MATNGFWGITKNGEEKMIYNHYDSYPEGLGKEVIFLIQNNLECLEKVFEKIILIKNIENLDKDEARFILISPSTLTSEKTQKRYFSESAKIFFENDNLEYGYMIDLDKSVLKLYKDKNLIAELPLNKIKYRDIAKAY